GLVFAVALELRLNIGPLRDAAQRVLDSLNQATANSTQGGSHSFLVRELQRLVDLRTGALDVLLATSLAYAVLELGEAHGLWHGGGWGGAPPRDRTRRADAVRDHRAPPSRDRVPGRRARRDPADRRVAAVPQAAVRDRGRSRAEGAGPPRSRDGAGAA